MREEKNPQAKGKHLSTHPKTRSLLKLPVAVPIPINEEPAFVIMALTSAKSTFTRPGIWGNTRHENVITTVLSVELQVS